ncbi:Aldo/keto reductase [Cordyceps militaris CM01]|uniref:Aldo/keto reductase n=1 Tax=Cordyceps militaris (strain CM01) TaxID=983644 RepID=G3J320_CORMM|nr:Aldo/keto reductase [Cordyceps militaris CM01]EGX95603.1 Aldo/keto reductase [Cordyceps militaris CM01]
MPLIVPTRTQPRVILGLMTFGPTKEAGARITDTATLGRALDVLRARGYDEIDTARIYIDGAQEAFTREAGWKDRHFTLATKVTYPQTPGANNAQAVTESVEKSLKELGADCVDVSEELGHHPHHQHEMLPPTPPGNVTNTRAQILYLHCPDRGTPFAETLEALDALHKAGKFVQLGLSNFAAHEVAEVVMTCKYNHWVRPTVYQGMYNCITRHIEKELFVACRRYGLDIVVYNPLAGGLLSGKIKSQDVVPESGRFSDEAGVLGDRYRARYFKDGVFRALQIAEEAVAKHGLTLIETALRWSVHHSGLRMVGGNDGVILGVSSVEQLESNLDSIEKGPLPEDVVKALDRAWEAAKQDAAPYWHGTLEYSYNTQQALFAPGAK